MGGEPHGCRRGARWWSLHTAHCGSCHRTFSRVSNFDAHRRGGACVDPASRGLVERGGVWRKAGGFYHTSDGPGA
jgi:hypothetical protein